MSNRWQLVKSIFERAVALEGEARESYLHESCGDDAELLTEVRGLIEADAGDDSILDHDARAVLDEPEPTETTIGPYLLLEKIGEGGMGEVWLAEQREPVQRRVALKIIKRGMDSEQVIARFAVERQALALMDHPAIAKVFDAGTTPRGRPYFAMEYVRGIPITEQCDRERLSMRERIDLFLRVCEGVQHAHQKGIIHRDIKPSNVLVALQQDEVVPKIIDFGVAKATQQRLTEKTVYTELGLLIGTPEYMSPEQADLTSQDIDTRTDVYALGVLLYELLAGALPFDPRELRKSGFDEIRRKIREEDPPTPSTRVVTLGDSHKNDAAQARRTDPVSLRRRLKGDLDWITMRALEKDRARRYGSPSELAADLRRHLADEPVEAGPPSVAYRARKFVRRNRLAVSFAAVLFALLVGFVVALAVQAGRIAKQRDLANRTAAELEQVARFQAEQLSGIEPDAMGARLRQSLLDERRAAFERMQGDPGTIEPALAELELALAPINFTNIARGALDDTVFDRTATAIESQFADQPLVRARLLQSLADALHQLGLAERARAAQTEALRIRRELLGDDHPQTLESIHGMGQGDPDRERALRSFREALLGRQRVLGPRHPDTIVSMTSVGVTWSGRLGKHEEGYPFLLEAVELGESALGVDHPITIEATLHLATTLSRLGRFEQAESRLRQAHETAGRSLGPEDPLARQATSILGGFLWTIGRLDEAEGHLRRSLADSRSIFGDDDRRTLGAIQTLAVLLEDQGRLDESEALVRRSLDAAERTLPPTDMIVMTGRHNLGFLQYRQGRLVEAERNLREVLESRRRVHGDDHHGTIGALGNLALVLVARERPEEAEPLARECVRRAVRTLGAEHWLVGNCRGQLGLAIAARGRVEEAERELIEAHRLLVDALGQEHERTRRVAGYLADL